MSIRTTRLLPFVGATALTLLVLALALLLGGGSGQAHAALPAGEVNPATASAPVRSSAKVFKTPSGRLACQSTDDVTGRPIVQCEVRLIGGGDYPKVQGRSRPKDCETDWGGVVEVHATGRATVPCSGGVMVTAKNPRTLAYGTRWKRGNYICLSREDALRCSTKSGAHGFKANRDVIRVW
ncbi:MAG: hypothetical protein PGN13_12940 [Patulibacter minatonensis]